MLLNILKQRVKRASKRSLYSHATWHTSKMYGKLLNANEHFFIMCFHRIIFCLYPSEKETRATALVWTAVASAQFLRQRQIPPEKVSGCAVHHQGPFLLSDSSHVLCVNRLINCTFRYSIRGSAMVYKVWNSIDPWGNPQSLDNYPAFHKNCLRGQRIMSSLSNSSLCRQYSCMEMMCMLIMIIIHQLCYCRLL